jgi:hypothetical protein
VLVIFSRSGHWLAQTTNPGRARPRLIGGSHEPPWSAGNRRGRAGRPWGRAVPGPARAGGPRRRDVRRALPESWALAVNPRTLDIPEPTGVTSRMLERGSRIHGVCCHRHGRIIAHLSFAGTHPRYPFMLALSQATSERLLAEALEAAGGAVERGVKMVECRSVPGGVEAMLPRAGPVRSPGVRGCWRPTGRGHRPPASRGQLRGHIVSESGTSPTRRCGGNLPPTTPMSSFWTAERFTS